MSGGYVIVINRQGPIPLRHIVEIHEHYNQNNFEKWYYDQYWRLDGDGFVFCATREERDAFVQSLGHN